MSHVFISYSHANTDIIRNLAKDLESRHFSVWYDDKIKPGTRWSDEIFQAIATSSALIVVMTPEAEKSEWVKKEIEAAIAEKVRIFPVLLSGERFEDLSHLQYVKFDSDGSLPQIFYDELEQFVRRTNSPLIVKLTKALIQEKGFERQPPSNKFMQLEPAALLLREYLVDINAFALIKADSLSDAEITALHQAFFHHLSDWRPAFFLKRGLGKTGVMGFVFENGCTQEKIDLIVKQRAATEESGLVLTDGARTVSWAIDVPANRVHSYEVVLPSLLPQAAFFYPGKEWIEQFLQKYSQQ
jgi:hypothetical protein